MTVAAEHQIRDAFDAQTALTIGLEDEVMLLDPESLDLVGLAPEAIAGSDRLKLELPASQVEIATAPGARVADVLAELTAGRRALVSATRGLARPAAAGTHPFSAPLGELNAGPRYDAILHDYGDVARSQLVCALQIHVAVGDADRTLAVYNALRGHLPEMAALAANAPFHAGRDTGLASVRPLICGLLPRQGVPPVIESWDTFANDLRWGSAAGVVPEPRRWWWELRPHVTHGTLEVRVPDAQSTLADAGAIAAFTQCLVAWLSDRYDAGEPLGTPASWRIAENRWSAARQGVDGVFADLETGAQRPAREVLLERVEDLRVVAERLDCSRELARAADLAVANGAIGQRAVAHESDLRGVAVHLADAFVKHL